MFNPRARISSKAEHDRLLRERANEEAATLFQTHGVDAVAMVTDGLIGGAKDADERRHDRLVILEIERLDRLRRNGSPASALVVWKPPLLSLARLRHFLRGKRAPRR